jgi:hypothetical protein
MSTQLKDRLIAAPPSCVAVDFMPMATAIFQSEREGTICFV